MSITAWSLWQAAKGDLTPRALEPINSPPSPPKICKMPVSSNPHHFAGNNKRNEVIKKESALSLSLSFTTVVSQALKI